MRNSVESSRLNFQRMLKAYLGRTTGMNANHWNDKLEWLKAVRTDWFNEDYIKFLIEKVWKINNPVNVIDFGCGFGYAGLIFLPLLPEGSTYTGIDISENLINEAKRTFEHSGYETTFIQADLNDYQPIAQYDIAISQAVLRHIPNADNILSKMIESVVNDGLVICMETDLELEKAGVFFEGLNNGELGLTPLMRKLWEKELANGGRDYRFAIKIPSLMKHHGLRNIGVRVSDRAYLIDSDSTSEQFDAFTSAWGWNRLLIEADKAAFIKNLMDKGLDENDAEVYFRGEQKIREYMSNKNKASIVKAPCTLISFGIK